LKSNAQRDGDEITFEVLHVDRKTMEIAVHPDGRVIIKAPIGTRKDAIEARVIKRSRWIRKKLDYFRQFEPKTPPKKYVGGETHMYLGHQYRLKLIKSLDEGVKLRGGYFCVSSRDPQDAGRIKALLDDWYIYHAKMFFHKRLLICHEMAKALRVPLPTMMLRKMKRRWGSCSKLGRIVLNTALVKASLYCIDYVIMHELCHLNVRHHTAEFWRLLKKFMPDWEERKARLEKMLA
jgi:predicted metal-dependent hydrolase